MTTVFCRVTADLSEDFVQLFPHQFDFHGLLERIAEDAGVYGDPLSIISCEEFTIIESRFTSGSYWKKSVHPLPVLGGGGGGGVDLIQIGQLVTCFPPLLTTC